MKNARILVVDDDIITLDTVKLLFAAYEPGFVVQTINNPLNTLESIANFSPDLIITDWEMPQMSGIDMIAEIKKHETYSEIPIIMTTGIMTNSESLMVALNIGAADFLRKPYDKTELLARVRSQLNIVMIHRELKNKNTVIEDYSRFLQKIFDSVPHPMVYCNIDAKIQGCNQTFEDFFGLKRSEIIGNWVYSYCEKDQRDFHIGKDKLLVNGDCPYISYEAEFGDNRSFLFSKSIYNSLNGAPEGVLCVMTDITGVKSAHNEVVESKKKELASSALRLIQMSELNNKIITDLAEISQYTNKKGSDLVRKLISEFDVMSNENHWKEFETRFENVYEAFYEKLNEKHPDLTHGERKMCALLRLNLSSKEIAALTFQNPQSVDIARYRIRKKLNLAKEVSLVSYFESI